MTINVTELPAKLYRNFGSLQHAIDFARGRVFLSTLYRCRAHENPVARDVDEGIIDQVLTDVTIEEKNPKSLKLLAGSGIQVNPGMGSLRIMGLTVRRNIPDAWVLCMSSRSDLTKFGPYCVEIDNPRLLIHGITTALCADVALREVGSGFVKYAERSYEDYEKPPGPLGFVKPRLRYGDEAEVRGLWLPHPAQIVRPRVVHVYKPERYLRLLP